MNISHQPEVNPESSDYDLDKAIQESLREYDYDLASRTDTACAIELIGIENYALSQDERNVIADCTDHAEMERTIIALRATKAEAYNVKNHPQLVPTVKEYSNQEEMETTKDLLDFTETESPHPSSSILTPTPYPSSSILTPTPCHESTVSNQEEMETSSANSLLSNQPQPENSSDPDIYRNAQEEVLQLFSSWKQPRTLEQPRTSEAQVDAIGYLRFF